MARCAWFMVHTPFLCRRFWKPCHQRPYCHHRSTAFSLRLCQSWSAFQEFLTQLHNAHFGRNWTVRLLGLVALLLLTFLTVLVAFVTGWAEPGDVKDSIKIFGFVEKRFLILTCVASNTGDMLAQVEGKHWMWRFCCSHNANNGSSGATLHEFWPRLADLRHLPDHYSHSRDPGIMFRQER